MAHIETEVRAHKAMAIANDALLECRAVLFNAMQQIGCTLTGEYLEEHPGPDFHQLHCEIVDLLARRLMAENPNEPSLIDGFELLAMVERTLGPETERQEP